MGLFLTGSNDFCDQIQLNKGNIGQGQLDHSQDMPICYIKAGPQRNPVETELRQGNLIENYELNNYLVSIFVLLYRWDNLYLLCERRNC